MSWAQETVRWRCTRIPCNGGPIIRLWSNASLSSKAKSRWHIALFIAPWHASSPLRDEEGEEGSVVSLVVTGKQDLVLRRDVGEDERGSL